MKKKIVLISIISIISIFSIILGVFMMDNEKPTRTISSVRVASNITNQIQHIDEFRLDKIVLDVKYDDENSQHKVLNKDMVEEFDLIIGYQELKLKDNNQIIPVLI